MPLLLLSGYPCSGKTKRTEEIKQFLEVEKGMKVTIVSENDIVGKEKNLIFSDSQREKEVRGRLKTEVLRNLNKEDVVILDAGNYIKGYRYELYCASKQHKTTQCLIYLPTSAEEAWKWNTHTHQDDRYDKDVFDALVMRYEEPNSSNRWDSPMVTILPTDSAPFEHIYASLYLSKPPPPNQSTQTQPLSSTNFLYELDKSTQDVISSIMAAQRTITSGEEIRITGIEEPVCLGRKVSLAELSRSRRQFISYTKMHPVENREKIMLLFVQYLNSTLG